jgi:hypothetical protein
MVMIPYRSSQHVLQNRLQCFAFELSNSDPWPTAVAGRGLFGQIKISSERSIGLLTYAHLQTADIEAVPYLRKNNPLRISLYDYRCLPFGYLSMIIVITYESFFPCSLVAHCRNRFTLATVQHKLFLSIV